VSITRVKAINLEKSNIWQVAVKGPFSGALDYLTTCQDLVPGMRVLVPLGRRSVIGLLIAPTERAAVEISQLKSIQAIIDTQPIVTSAWLQLVQRLAHYYHQPLGLLVDLALPKRLLDGEAYQCHRVLYALTEIGQQQLQLPGWAKKAPRQHATLLAAQQAPLSSAQLQQLKLTASVRRAMLDKTWLREQSEVVMPIASEVPASSAYDLTVEQQQALDHCMKTTTPWIGLLEGVTGSGKTEVYLQWAAHLLAQGKQILVLVPEIGLTQQTLQRFQARLQVPVATYHSAMTDTERMRVWYWAHHGLVNVVLGTRSALLLPFANLGAMIVDESHDHSYWQQTTVYFSGREAALMRGRIESVPVLLGTATPSLEVLYHALNGRYDYWRLTARHQAALPTPHIIDMRQQPVEGGLSYALKQVMAQHLQQGGQVVVFLNRRGYAPVLLCHCCGWSAKHEGCGRHFTWYQSRHRLVCHHCDVVTAVPSVCPQCKAAATQFVGVGAGTERLEAVLKRTFPDEPLVRIDRDVVQHKGALDAALDQIHAGFAKIIIGTQMIAKGHHFTAVTLVAVVDVDGALYSLDFRALERLGQVITQVAGRAGRADKPGEVYLQTHQPDHPMLRLLLKEGYHALAKKLLVDRQQVGWPPFSYLAAIRAEGKQQRIVIQTLQQIKQQVLRQQAAPLTLSGPVPCLLSQRAGLYRYQVLLQTSERKVLHQWLQWLQTLSMPTSVRLQWLVDPQEV
jgi:primosomal protein N' (replication factor Y)